MTPRTNFSIFEQELKRVYNVVEHDTFYLALIGPLLSVVSRETYIIF